MHQHWVMDDTTQQHRRLPGIAYKQTQRDTYTNHCKHHAHARHVNPRNVHSIPSSIPGVANNTYSLTRAGKQRRIANNTRSHRGGNQEIPTT